MEKQTSFFDEVRNFVKTYLNREIIHVIWIIIWVGLIKATRNVTGI